MSKLLDEYLLKNFNNKELFDMIGTFDGFPCEFFTYFLNKNTGKIVGIRFSYTCASMKKYGELWDEYDVNSWWKDYSSKDIIVLTKKYEYLKETS